MPRKLAWLALAVALAGCSSSTSVPTPAAKPSPEEDPRAPGMIPKDCETLLNKSQEWGYTANGNKWKPASQAQALEVAQFFSTFHLVPQSTSNFTDAWLSESRPAAEQEAAKSLERLNRAQTCDLLLAHKILLGLVHYKWSAENRERAAGYLHSFTVNQQARISPALARAVQLDVLGHMAQRRLIRADAGTIKNLRAWFDAETAKIAKRAQDVKTSHEQWELSREEWQISEQAREKLGRILPLP